jgi:hypothetical protein
LEYRAILNQPSHFDFFFRPALLQQQKKQNPNSNTRNPVQALGLKARTANERVARTCTERLWAAVRFGKIIVPMIFASPFLLA